MNIPLDFCLITSVGSGGSTVDSAASPSQSSWQQLMTQWEQDYSQWNAEVLGGGAQSQNPSSEEVVRGLSPEESADGVRGNSRQWEVLRDQWRGSVDDYVGTFRGRCSA